MSFNLNNITYDDSKTWDLICSGNTKGCFQMESHLVQHWLKAIQPRNIWELSAVIALVRPGPLKSGFADEYLAYRNGTKEFESFGHPIIDSIFDATEHVLLYQESLLHLGNRLAWKNLDEVSAAVKSDVLRKAVGKKDQKKLLEIGREFMNGCIANGVTQEVAEKLFEVIKNCGRYVFNLSHSISYAFVGYRTAYCKAHFPREFFTTYFTYAEHKLDKWQEIKDLYYDLNYFDLELVKPNINKKNANFSYEDDKILYGLSHVKHFGKSNIKVLGGLPEIKTWQQVIQLGFTDKFKYKLRQNALEALICTGAFSDTKVSRKTLVNVITFFNSLTPKELGWITDNLYTITSIKELPTLVNSYINNNKSRRENDLRDTIALTNLDDYDNPAWIEAKEIYYLGVPITATSVDNKQLYEDSCWSCQGDLPLWTTKTICVVLDDVFLTKTKRGTNPGQSMATISVHDSTGNLNKLPVFPEQYDNFQQYLLEGNTVALEIKMGRKGWVVQKVEQI